MDDDDQRRRVQGRSPPFPFIPLDRAIERAKTFAEYSKGHPVRVSSAVQGAWGYNPKSSGGSQTVAALKAFGLIRDMGSGDERKIQLSDEGQRLLRNPPPTVLKEILWEAATRPKLIGEYWNKWGIDRPPDEECRWTLMDDRGFTPDAAAKFLAVYDATLSYAGLTNSDGHIDVESEPETDMPVAQFEWREAPARVHWQPEGAATPPKEIPGFRKAVFPLLEGDVTLHFPASLSSEGYDELADYLDIFLKRAKREANKTEETPR